MTETQIKDYLKKYRIDSEESLAKHIEELKRNTKPNNEIIFTLVDLLLNEKSVLLSFFRENSKERGETVTKTTTPFFLDEAVISYQSFENVKFKDNTVTYTSTRHKSQAGETHKISNFYVCSHFKTSIYKKRRCVVMHDAPLFLFITIQICSLSLSCDLLKISLIYVFPASKNSSCKLIKQSNQPVHTLFCQFCTHLFYIEGNG